VSDPTPDHTTDMMFAANAAASLARLLESVRAAGITAPATYMTRTDTTTEVYFNDDYIPGSVLAVRFSERAKAPFTASINGARFGVVLSPAWGSADQAIASARVLADRVAR